MSFKESSLPDKGEELIQLNKAILIGAYFNTAEKGLCAEYLNELDLLCQTLGLNSIKQVLCPIKKRIAATFIGKGKIEEIRLMKEDLGADVIVFDDEILPSQQRNLEDLFKCPVMDRTEIILDIFYQRAQSHEAKIQIEIARIKYQTPRLKRMWTHLSRQKSGGVYLKGEGEKQIELDKRMLQKRLERLLKNLKDIQNQRKVQRAARLKSGIPSFAIIGYTNAGKSTLLHALTEADVLIEDKLFATLDTTTRRFNLPNNQDILLIDTVGFIRKLPHMLVAAFRSTLEESLQADILLHLIDASHPLAEKQSEATFDLLKELKSEKKPMITLLNKIDALDDQQILRKFSIKYSKTIPISAKNKQGLEDLQEIMVEELKKLRQEVRVKIPQKSFSLVSEISRKGHILFQEYENDNVIIRAQIPVEMMYKIEPYLI